MYHLLATFAAAFGVAGLIYAVFRTVRRRPPKFLIPVAAGLAMLGYNIWSEYAWHSRTVAALPQHVTVVETLPYQAAWQPWTYIFPRVDRLIAVDLSRIRRNDKAPGYVLTDVLLVERLEPTKTLTQMFDCNDARVTSIISDQELDDNGVPVNANWLPVRTDNRLYRSVCQSL